MRRLNITLDDETDHLLAQHTNQAETVRQAIKMYHSGITTDTLESMVLSYRQLRKFMEDKFEFYDIEFKRMDKLINQIENTML